MAFWLIRGLIALAAVIATVVPAGIAVDHGLDVMQAQAEQQDRQTDAHQELLIYQSEIQLAENRARARSGSADFLQAQIAEARVHWGDAADDWRAGSYAQMADHISTGRAILVEVQLIEATDMEAFTAQGWTDGPGQEPVLRMDLIVASLAIAALFWTIWGGISQRVQQAVPVPVFPGEVEIERPPEATEDADDNWFREKEAEGSRQRRRSTLAGSATTPTKPDAGARDRRDGPRRDGPTPAAVHRPKVVRKVKAKPLPPVDEDHDDDPVTPS